jgi:hypothetical protein
MADLAGVERGVRRRRRSGRVRVCISQIFLLAPSIEASQRMLDAVIQATTVAGLRVNVDKTTLVVPGEGELRVGDA